MSNARNSRTTHPRKQARRQRAADRFHFMAERRSNKGYMERKTTEAIALGLSAWLLSEVS